MIIYNTFKFVPKFHNSDIRVMSANNRGSIIAIDDTVKEGFDILVEIKNYPDRLFLVSAKAYDYCKSCGWDNVCMLDYEGAKRDSEGRAISYKGVIQP